MFYGKFTLLLLMLTGNLVSRAGTVVYVNQAARGVTNGQSWDTGFRTVAQGLNGAQAGDQVFRVNKFRVRGIY